MIWDLFALLGVAAAAYWLAARGVYFLRAVFWSVWTCIPVARANPDRVTMKRVWGHLWKTFWSEWTGWKYDEVSCQYYSHGYWPWNPKKYN